jgi:hypothetical protein
VETPVKFDYLKVPLNKMTFSRKPIREWVELQCVPRVLNLFSGATKLNVDEVRNDVREEMPADYHMDALEFVTGWSGEKFSTIILDPPYAYRKSMEMYGGAVSSAFNAVKNGLSRILVTGGRVITFGYHSISMGRTRGFHQDRILLMSHGGAIHDTIATVEVFDG